MLYSKMLNIINNKGMQMNASKIIFIYQINKDFKRLIVVSTDKWKIDIIITDVNYIIVNLEIDIKFLETNIVEFTNI